MRDKVRHFLWTIVKCILVYNRGKLHVMVHLLMGWNVNSGLSVCIYWNFVHVLYHAVIALCIFFVVEEEKNAQVSCMNNICILSWLLVLLG